MCLRAVVRLVQLLPGAQVAQSHPRDGSRDYGSHLDNRGVDSLVHTRKQLRHFQAKSLGNSSQALKREIPFPALHLADVRPMQIAGRGQILLRPFPLFPQLADTDSEGSLDVLCHPRSVED